MLHKHLYHKDRIIEIDTLSKIFKGAVQISEQSKKNLMIFVSNKSSYQDMLMKIVGDKLGKELIKNKPVVVNGVNVTFESPKSLAPMGYYSEHDIIFAFHVGGPTLDKLDEIMNFELIIVASEEDCLDPWIKKHSATPITINI